MSGGRRQGGENPTENVERRTAPQNIVYCGTCGPTAKRRKLTCRGRMPGPCINVVTPSHPLLPLRPGWAASPAAGGTWQWWTVRATCGWSATTAPRASGDAPTERSWQPGSVRRWVELALKGMNRAPQGRSKAARPQLAAPFVEALGVCRGPEAGGCTGTMRRCSTHTH